jgi:hypothetical protein
MTTKITGENNNLNLDRDYMDNCCTSVVAKPKLIKISLVTELMVSSRGSTDKSNVTHDSSIDSSRRMILTNGGV